MNVSFVTTEEIYYAVIIVRMLVIYNVTFLLFPKYQKAIGIAASVTLLQIYPDQDALLDHLTCKKTSIWVRMRPIHHHMMKPSTALY